jgi:hypothetical protein
MNKNELKKILRPLIKECVKEVIFEEGTLSTIISEVVKGTSSQQVITENQKQFSPQHQSNREVKKRKQLSENKKRMLDAIGRDAYNGIDLFEGTTATTSRGNSTTSPHGSNPMDGTDPSDPGVDITGFGMNKEIWKKLAGN